MELRPPLDCEVGTQCFFVTSVVTQAFEAESCQSLQVPPNTQRPETQGPPKWARGGQGVLMLL